MNSAMLKHFVPEQQRTERVIAAVKTVSEEVGRSIAQAALAWLRYREVPEGGTSGILRYQVRARHGNAFIIHRGGVVHESGCNPGLWRPRRIEV